MFYSIGEELNWLITGGAGYVGAHVVERTIASGREVFVVDDLSTGIAERLSSGTPLAQISLAEKKNLEHAFGELEISGVLHLAAKKRVGESVELSTWI